MDQIEVWAEYVSQWEPPQSEVQPCRFRICTIQHDRVQPLNAGAVIVDNVETSRCPPLGGEIHGWCGDREMVKKYLPEHANAGLGDPVHVSSEIDVVYDPTRQPKL